MQIAITPEAIQASAAAITASAGGPIQKAQVMNDYRVEVWPGKQAADHAVVYVALSGESFSEAFSLALAKYGEDILTRHLEWGRS